MGGDGLALTRRQPCGPDDPAREVSLPGHILSRPSGPLERHPSQSSPP